MASVANPGPTQDDDLYEALYDVRKEAEEIGNYIDHDPYPTMNALRERAPVRQGFMRQLMEASIPLKTSLCFP